MTESFLNPDRPPIFCPGCSHEKVLRVLDRTLDSMGLRNDRICLVTDIGCSGFFDVFFNTHALHGLHGRSLTYATGIKLCRPELNVIVTMGDGGLGIGAAHLIAACRRNLDLTLLVLNNFNFGMTGGQCSATTPTEAVVGSGFLNRLEKPLDAVSLAASAGAAFVCRCSAYQSDLGEVLEQAVRFKGFSVVDIHGICPGRYARLNRITPATISEYLASQDKICGEVQANLRPEFGDSYRREAGLRAAVPRPSGISPRFAPPEPSRKEVVMLGAAGQRVATAGEVLALAGLTAGMNATRKNEYNVTVLRGPSNTEVILSPDPIDYHGCSNPGFVIALADEGVSRRRNLFQGLASDALVFAVQGVELPDTRARVQALEFSGRGIKRADWAMASLGVLAGLGRVISLEMLHAALEIRFSGDALTGVTAMLDRVQAYHHPQ